MTKKLFTFMALGAVLILVLGFAPQAVFARDGEDDDQVTTTSAEDETENENETETENVDENEVEAENGDDNSGRGGELKEMLKELRADRRQHRLDANKLRVCENRKTRVTAIMNRSILRAERQLALFDTIAQRVEAFYVEKGYSVANYDELVAAVTAAKAEAEANLETLKGLEPFDCSSEDPKGQIEEFKLALKSIRKDLKDYRTSVKNLIVGVKSANSTEGGEE